jgi:hypothetical protein
MCLIRQLGAAGTMILDCRIGQGSPCADDRHACKQAETNSLTKIRRFNLQYFQPQKLSGQEFKVNAEYFISALQSVRITHGCEDFFPRRVRRERRETTGRKKDTFRVYFISATSAPLRAHFPFGRVLVWACAQCQAVQCCSWNKMF